MISYYFQAVAVIIFDIRYLLCSVFGIVVAVENLKTNQQAFEKERVCCPAAGGDDSESNDRQSCVR